MWKESTYERYWYYLEVLPPIYGPGMMFACSEPLWHNEDGKPVYTICDYRGGLYWETEGTVGQMKKGELK